MERVELNTRLDLPDDLNLQERAVIQVAEAVRSTVGCPDGDRTTIPCCQVRLADGDRARAGVTGSFTTALLAADDQTMPTTPMTTPMTTPTAKPPLTRRAEPDRRCGPEPMVGPRALR